MANSINNNFLYKRKYLGTGNLGENIGDNTVRMWKIKFPANSNARGTILVTFSGGHNAVEGQDASGYIEKEININYSGETIYNNLGYYKKLTGNIENDFRVSELIWNGEEYCWEIQICSVKVEWNNKPTHVYIHTTGLSDELVNGIVFEIEPCFETFTASTTYQAEKARVTKNESDGVSLGQKTVKWFDIPVCESPYGKPLGAEGEIPPEIEDRLSALELNTHGLFFVEDETHFEETKERITEFYIIKKE